MNIYTFHGVYIPGFSITQYFNNHTYMGNSMQNHHNGRIVPCPIWTHRCNSYFIQFSFTKWTFLKNKVRKNSTISNSDFLCSYQLIFKICKLITHNFRRKHLSYLSESFWLCTVRALDYILFILNKDNKICSLIVENKVVWIT